MSNPDPAASSSNSASRPLSIKVLTGISWSVAMVAAGSVLLLTFLWGRSLNPTALTYSGDALRNLSTVLTPLIAISLFVERAVEVIITAWREPRANQLKNPDPGSEAWAQRKLAEYRMQTQQLSFVTSLTISVVAALVGVRAVSPLVTGAPTTGLFVTFDVLITGLLLAGGADGMHQIVTTFTKFLDTSKEKMSAATSSGGASSNQGNQGNQGQG